MDFKFSTWGNVLMQLCQHLGSFLTNLVDNMATLLLTADEAGSGDGDDNDTYNEGLYSWLDHILNSESWARSRMCYLSLCYVDAICQDNNNNGRWISRLRSQLGQTYKRLDGVASESNKNNGPKSSDGRKKRDVAEDFDAMDTDDPDIEVLRTYGWDLRENWKPRPIGVS